MFIDKLSLVTCNSSSSTDSSPSSQFRAAMVLEPEKQWNLLSNLGNDYKNFHKNSLTVNELDIDYNTKEQSVIDSSQMHHEYQSQRIKYDIKDKGKRYFNNFIYI